MKNKLLKNIVLTLVVCSVIAVPAFAQNKKNIAQQFDILPISYIFKHWAETYVEQLKENFDVEELFVDKGLDNHITAEDFMDAVKLTIDKDYANEPKYLTREAIVYEVTKIWAEKTDKDLERIPIIKMLIYQDTSEIDTEYVNGVYIAYMYDIAKGRGNGKFDPKTNVTYGELATLLNNTHNAIEKELNIHPIIEGKYETRANYEIKDGKVIFNFELMSHYTDTTEIMFGSGQQFELIITNEDGQEVYKFSDGRFFTMALIYKSLGPGESLQWQDEWDMTDKEGEKLLMGSYKAEIRVLAVLEEDKIPEEQLTAVIEFSLNNEKSIISPELAKGIIEVRAKDLLKAIEDKDAEKISEYVHPVKGVRFTPYTTVSIESDRVFNKVDIVKFFEDENSYEWGYYDGSGFEIILTPSQYYENFIYSEDFMNAPEVGYNEVLSFGNMIENQFEVYESPIVVEYYIPEINPEFDGLDWQSLRLVFEEFEGSWLLVGIIHNQWTI